MDDTRAKKLIEAVIAGSNTLSEIAATARRNRKPLIGSGYYGEKFHDGVVKFTKLHAALRALVAAIDGFDVTSLEKYISTVTSVTADTAQRDEARKQLRLILETTVLPLLGKLTSPAAPAAEMVLPSSVLAQAPTYLQRTLLQANGCYEQRWFDACSVMIRKLVENLIIDVYEKHGKHEEIKKDGNYFMLSGLVTTILSQSHWQLQRETKRELPQIKTLGDRAAHNRRYQATRQDVDQVRTGLRATVDDLLHLAGYK
jgi:hypothetical protein